MLSKKTTDQVKLIAYATVSNLFAEFHNEKNRGENFTWDKFADLAERSVKRQVFLSVVLPKKQEEEALEYGRKVGNEIATNMVKLMKD